MSVARERDLHSVRRAAELDALLHHRKPRNETQARLFSGAPVGDSNARTRLHGDHGPLRSSGRDTELELAPPGRLERPHTAPEAAALSAELRGQGSVNLPPGSAGTDRCAIVCAVDIGVGTVVAVVFGLGASAVAWQRATLARSHRNASGFAVGAGVAIALLVVTASFVAAPGFWGAIYDFFVGLYSGD
jgi:hypothetical protein